MSVAKRFCVELFTALLCHEPVKKHHVRLPTIGNTLLIEALPLDSLWVYSCVRSCGAVAQCPSADPSHCCEGSKFTTFSTHSFISL